MNAKVRQDLYRLSIPAFRNTMLIGVDLIMSGSGKLIGMCATSNQHLTQCFTKLVKQKMAKREESDKDNYPGKSLREIQEIKTSIERAEILKTFVYEAVGNFNKNTKTLPEQIVIYRDGMGGPTMTAKVEKLEIKVITDMLESTTAGYKPKIVYCLVDRNIQHRLFHKVNGDTLNPGPGTCVDAGVVE